MEGERIAKTLLIYREKYRSALGRKQQQQQQQANGDALSPTEGVAATTVGGVAGVNGAEAATASQRKRSSELIRRVKILNNGFFK